MNNIDRKITEALRASYPDANLTAEPNLAEELLTAFRGRNLFFNIMAFVLSLVSLGIFIWSAIRFYQAPEVRDMLLWGGLCLFTVIFISFMKVWFWLEMHSNRVLREVKRIELLLCHEQAEHKKDRPAAR